MYIEPLGLNPDSGPLHTTGPVGHDILLNADWTHSIYSSGSPNYVDVMQFNNAAQYWTNVTNLTTINGTVVSNDTYAFHYLFNILCNATQATNDTFNGNDYLVEDPNPST